MRKKNNKQKHQSGMKHPQQQKMKQPKQKEYTVNLEFKVKAESKKVVENICDALIFDHSNIEDYEITVIDEEEEDEDED